MLTFDEAGHAYRFDGRRVPSVTQVLSAAGMLDFGNARDEAMLLARARGQAVHKACELDDAGNLDEDSVDEEIVGHLAAWRRFRAECGFDPVAVEERVYHKTLRYAGTLDTRGPVRGKHAVIDRKTGSAQAATGPQTAAYAHAVDPMGRLDRYSIILQPDGRYKLIPHTDPTDWSAFLSALNLHQWKERHNVRSNHV